MVYDVCVCVAGVQDGVQEELSLLVQSTITDRKWVCRGAQTRLTRTMNALHGARRGGLPALLPAGESKVAHLCVLA